MSGYVGYLRVSTKGQAKDGQGLDVQRKLIEQWAKSHGVKIQAWHSDEGISGTYPVERRPGLLAAINDVKSRASQGKPAGLVVRDFSRLAREQSVSVMVRMLIEKAGGELRSADATQDAVGQSSDPMAVFQAQLFTSLDQLDRSLLVTKLAAGRAMKASKGGHAVGAPGYGWRAQGRDLVPDDAEQATLRRIRALRADGASLRTIAAELNERGTPTKRGGQWQANSVRQALAQRVAGATA